VSELPENASAAKLATMSSHNMKAPLFSVRLRSRALRKTQDRKLRRRQIG
jgi:hypothetical protein